MYTVVGKSIERDGAPVAWFRSENEARSVCAVLMQLFHRGELSIRSERDALRGAGEPPAMILGQGEYRREWPANGGA